MPQLSRTTANAGSTASGSPPRSLSPPSTSWSADASPRNSRCSGRRDAVVEAGRPPAPADPNQSSRRHAARPVHHLVSGHGCQRQPSPSSRHGGLSISQALTCSLGEGQRALKKGFPGSEILATETGDPVRKKRDEPQKTVFRERLP